MAAKIPKKVLAQVRKLFRRDMDRLEPDYKLWEIAEKTGIDQGNLSSYKSGAKQPGIDVLMQFYAAFAGELENPFDKINIMEDEKVNNNQQSGSKGKRKTAGPGANSEYNQGDGSSSTTDDPEKNPFNKQNATCWKDELIEAYKTDNAHLRHVNNRMLDSGDKWLNSIDKMTAAQDKANQADLINAETHRMVIDSFLRKNGGQ